MTHFVYTEKKTTRIEVYALNFMMIRDKINTTAIRARPLLKKTTGLITVSTSTYARATYKYVAVAPQESGACAKENLRQHKIIFCEISELPGKKQKKSTPRVELHFQTDVVGGDDVIFAQRPTPLETQPPLCLSDPPEATSSKTTPR